MLRTLILLSLPILVAQLASMSVMVIDTALLGQYGANDLAALAIGGGIYITISFMLAGILQAIAPIAAHHAGAGRGQELASSLRQGFWLALVLSVPGIALLLNPGPLLAMSSMSAEIEAKTRLVLQIEAIGLPAALFYRTFYAFSNALGRGRILMLINLTGASLHLPLAWSLVFGHWGPQFMGAPGCALSAALIAWFALLCGLIVLVRDRAISRYRVFSQMEWPRWLALREFITIGFPIGLSNLIEISAFTLMALFIAPLGAEVVAGHRIVANISAILYMIPLSIGIATLSETGKALGARQGDRARHAVLTALTLATVLSIVMAILTFLFKDTWIGLFTEAPEVATAARGLILWIAAYQIFDAIQTIAAFALRSYKITLLPMIIHAFSFWVIGLGLGWYLAFRGLPPFLPPQGAAGYWIAATAATTVAAVLFGLLLRITIRDKTPV